MKSDIDYSTIEHLDFDIEEDKSPSCYGYRFWQDGNMIAERRPCSNKPILIATRSCCGQIYYYCMDCYNVICNRGCDYHGPPGKQHLIDGKPFSHVHFL